MLAQALDRRQGRLAASRLTLSLARESRSSGPPRFADLLGQTVEDPATFDQSIGFSSRRDAIEVEDLLRERDKRRRRARSFDRGVELAELVGQMVLEEQIVDLAVLAQPVEVELPELVEPLLGELANPLIARRRSRRRATTLQAAPVDRVPLDRSAELAAVVARSPRSSGASLRSVRDSVPTSVRSAQRRARA